MSILVDKNTRLVVQGMTGSVGQFHTEQMLAYGTKVVAGCTPGRGGQSLMDVPVFDTMRDVVRGHPRDGHDQSSTSSRFAG
jgi:succinyl-CoA synthetase alpha subunit